MDVETAVINERYEVALNRVRVTTLTEDLPASDLLLDRDVVFRALKPELTTDRSFVDRFRKQVQAAANLTHPNIVSVFDWGRERDGFADRPGPVYFVITERNLGRSVWSYVNDKGPLPIERVIHILLGVTSAVGYAHRSGTLHGGLRPELVSVSPNGLVKVSDFGFLEAIGSLAALPGATVDDVQWLAPELGAGELPDHRTDVYGIGQLCYFLVTGRLPYTGDTVEEVLKKQQTGVPPAPRKLRPELPRALEVIIGRCLAKRPADRFASVNEVRAALVRLQETMGGRVTGSPSAEPGIERTDAQVKTRTDESEAARARAVADGGEPAGPDEPTRIHIPPARPGITPPLSLKPVVPVVTASPPVISGTTAAAVAPIVAPAAATNKAPTQANRPPTFAADHDAPPFDEDATSLAIPAPKRNGGSSPNQPNREPNREPVEQLDDTMFSPVRRRPSIRGWMILFAMLAVLAGLLALLAQTLKDSRSEIVTVPNVISKTTDAATAELTSVGLRVETKYETNTQVSREVVFAQNPEPNADVAAGALITLTVSSGDGILRVPDVVGQSEAVATSTLLNSGFSVRPETRADASAAPGNVIEQNPRGDTEARAGDKVTIIVAARTGTAKVPEVAGESPQEATVTLTGEGFRTVLRDEANSTTEKGLVTRTEPAAGVETDRNTAVIVFVSRGPAIQIPSVYGQNEAAATETLKALGFVVDRQTRFVTKPADVGVVIDQTPKGVSAVVGSTVSIVVGELDPAGTTIASEGGTVVLVTTTTLPPPSTTVPPATTVAAPVTTIAAPEPTQPPVTAPPATSPPATNPPEVVPTPVPVAVPAVNAQ